MGINAPQTPIGSIQFALSLMFYGFDEMKLGSGVFLMTLVTTGAVSALAQAFTVTMLLHRICRTIWHMTSTDGQHIASSDVLVISRVRDISQFPSSMLDDKLQDTKPC